MRLFARTRRLSRHRAEELERKPVLKQKAKRSAAVIVCSAVAAKEPLWQALGPVFAPARLAAVPISIDTLSQGVTTRILWIITCQ